MSQLPMPYNPLLGPNPQQGGDLFPSVPQAQNPLHRAMSSPWAMMASTALNNVGAMSSGRQPQGNPMQAYQQSVAAQAAQRRADAAEQRSQAEHQRRMDPFFEFEEAKRRGIIDPSMSYAEWLNISKQYKGFDTTAPMKNFAQREILAAEVEAAETPEEKEAAQRRLDTFDNYVRSSSPFGGGGGSQYVRTPDGRLVEVISSDSAIAREAKEKSATTEAQEVAKTDVEYYDQGVKMGRSSWEGYRTAENMRKKSEEWLRRFNSDDPNEQIETGPLIGFMANMFGIGPEELGELKSDTISTALVNLGITNLAPVTEKEFAEVMRMWADISQSPSMNRGSLQAIINKTTRLMRMLQDDALYGAALVEEYGSEQRYNAFLRTNPFVNDLLTDPSSKMKTGDDIVDLDDDEG